jgi:hypothetical protein
VSRKNPPMWGGACPTCGGAEVVTARRGGRVRLYGDRSSYTPAQYRKLDQIARRWRPAAQACYARVDSDDVYHGPDAVGLRLVHAAWEAEKLELVGPPDESRRSIRVYWPTRRFPKRTLAWCPDLYHARSSFRRYVDPPEEPAPTRRRTGPLTREARAELEERRRERAVRHKERQARR